MNVFVCIVFHFNGTWWQSLEAKSSVCLYCLYACIVLSFVNDLYVC